MGADVEAFFHQGTQSLTYLVSDPGTGAAAVIDPVLDYDWKRARISTGFVEGVLASVQARGLKIAWILETHVHADHLSGADWLRKQTGARLVIGAGVAQVQKAFIPLFGAYDVEPDGSAFDELVEDGDRLPLGSLQIEAMATPGHTPACVSYRIGDAVFIGDTMFMPDLGTARCDFPGGDAATLYRSIHRLYAQLPEDTRVFVCHDYGPGGRAMACETTLGAQRRENIHVRDGMDEAAFVELRTARDATLAMPALLLPAVQVNIRAGALPEPESNGVRYLKLPLDQF
jgi:glyoxylase-like metal-dependent hydrolase (beta-lactamase superfamily II)